MDDLMRVINIATFLPPVTRDSRDIQELARVENDDLQVLWDALCGIFYDQFITTTTQYGLQQWEQIFDIMPKVTDTLQVRRQRILQELMGTRPYTMLSFQAILDGIYGPGKVTISVNNNTYEFWMEITADTMPYNLSIRAFAETIVPKNLLIFIRNMQELTLRQYTGGYVCQQASVTIKGYTGVNMEDMAARQYTGGYVRIIHAIHTIGGQ